MKRSDTVVLILVILARGQRCGAVVLVVLRELCAQQLERAALAAAEQVQRPVERLRAAVDWRVDLCERCSGEW